MSLAPLLGACEPAGGNGGEARPCSPAWLRRLIDTEEAWAQLRFAVPMVLTNMSYYSIPLVSVMFSGHLGNVHLAGSTLGNSWATVTGYALVDCIGAIDGTHVTAKVPRSQSVAYRGRKHYTSQNVLVVVDFDLKFTYLLADWEGSAHDANILSDSMSRPDGINIPDDKFYLGDAGYACRPGVLPPFRKTRYHLNEFASRNYPMTPQELFNLRHSSLRVTVERAFGDPKNRFKILDHKPFHTFPTQVKLVLACCILHNWILQRGCDELVPEEEEATPDDVVSSGHGVKAFDNEAWKNKRMEWAQAMWENKGQTKI